MDTSKGIANSGPITNGGQLLAQLVSVSAEDDNNDFI
jgi:hypothetical protein